MSAKRIKALAAMSDIFSEIMHAQIMKKKDKASEPKEDASEESEEEAPEKKKEPKEEVKTPSWMNKIKAPEQKG